MNLEKLKINDLNTVKPVMMQMGFSPEKFTKEAGFVAQIWNNPKSSYLRKATKESLLSSVISIAQTGLTLNPVAKQAYLIPRGAYVDGQAIVQAHLEPSYIGLLKLLTDAGQVKNIQTNLVYEGDDFDVSLGLETQISHKPHYITKKPKGKIIGVYAVANILGGLQQFEYMTSKEIENIRATSESYKAYLKNPKLPCIWNTYEGEMFRKTVIKRIAKHLPRSEQFDQANELTNTDFEMSNTQLAMIESLLQTTNLMQHEKDKIENDLFSMSHSGAQQTIQYLKDNQLNAIESGNNYDTKDIGSMIDSKMDDPNA